MVARPPRLNELLEFGMGTLAVSVSRLEIDPIIEKQVLIAFTQESIPTACIRYFHDLFIICSFVFLDSFSMQFRCDFDSFSMRFRFIFDAISIHFRCDFDSFSMRSRFTFDAISLNLESDVLNTLTTDHGRNTRFIEQRLITYRLNEPMKSSWEYLLPCRQIMSPALHLLINHIFALFIPLFNQFRN